MLSKVISSQGFLSTLAYIADGRTKAHLVLIPQPHLIFLSAIPRIRPRADTVDLLFPTPENNPSNYSRSRVKYALCISLAWILAQSRVFASQARELLFQSRDLLYVSMAQVEVVLHDQSFFRASAISNSSSCSSDSLANAAFATRNLMTPSHRLPFQRGPLPLPCLDPRTQAF